MTDTPGRLAPARHAHILTVLARDGHVRISRLSRELGVAPVTLRRDFAELERTGRLQRVHGGAVAAAGSSTGTGSSGAAGGSAGGAIAVLVPSLNYYWPTVVRGIEAAAARHDLRVVLRGASYELQDERPVLERLVRDESLLGLILAPNTDTDHAHDVAQWLAASPLPSVLVERDATVAPGHEPLESVTSDHALGAALAARHLAAHGHRRVGLIRTRFSPTSRKIVTGWRAATAELGLTSSPTVDVVLPDQQSPEFSAAADRTIAAAVDDGVSALLVHSDREAMAVVDLALERGLSVPGDLSVIAYDDELADLFTPALTAVSPPRTAVGRAAVELLLARRADPDRPVHRVTVSPRLVERETTGDAPGRGAATTAGSP